MKFVELSSHLRKLRQDKTGRAPSAAMRVMEVWQAAIACQVNGISDIFYNETKLPAPLLGFFSRMRNADGREVADIFVHRPHPSSTKRRLAPHWKEFVIIKELMHCWSPSSTYVGSPDAAAELINTLNTPSGPFGAMAASDYMALLAAAEVIMPCSQIKAAMEKGKDSDQLAHEQGVHTEIMGYICRHDIMEQRLDGSL